MSVPPSLASGSAAPSAAASEKVKAGSGLFKEILACFRSLQLAIILLSLLAAGILIGVFLPQEGLVEFQQIKSTYGPATRFLKAMGLFNVYSSYWFVSVQVLFFVNLLLGSFKWLKPAFTSATRKTFCSAQSIRKAKHHFKLISGENETRTLSCLIAQLKKKHYFVYTRRDPNQPEQWQIYATKGNIGRLGPVFAHCGILMFLVASVFGNLTGFKAQQVVIPGQTFDLRHAEKLTLNLPRPFWLGDVPDLKIHVRDFHIRFYPDHPATPQQYYTNLDVLDRTSRQTVARTTISVNHPLVYGNLTIYQASFAPTGRLFFQVNGKPQALTVNANIGNRPVCMMPLPGKAAATLVVFPFMVQQDPGVSKNRVRVMLLEKGRFAGAGAGRMPDNLRLEEGQSGVLDGIPLTFRKLEYATGLQMKSAPEVFWVYFSYLVIAIGTIMCLFAQRQLWVAMERCPETNGYELFFLYRTNKMRLVFLKELEIFRQQLQQRLNPDLKTGAMANHE